MKKCKYYNNHQTACSLMIDDLVPAAISINNVFGPHNDWGYFKKSDQSLYNYLDKKLFSKYPEIRGTIFLPFKEHTTLVDNGYKVLRGEFDNEYNVFLKEVNSRFDFAFHGILHTWMKDNSIIYEFENFNINDFANFEAETDYYLKLTQLYFSGGKFPGYKYNDDAILFMEKMNYKWIALNAEMINKKSRNNQLSFIKGTKLVNIPSNISGDIFGFIPQKGNTIKKLVKQLIFPERYIDPEKYIEYLYLNGYPLIVQEHYQNQRSDGKRQTPNLFDDIYSLDKIYGILRPLDVWNATCSEIAHYYDSFVNTDITFNNDQTFKITYTGNWETMFLSFVSETKKIENTATKQVFEGFAKDKKYIFNNLTQGIYRHVHTN